MFIIHTEVFEVVWVVLWTSLNLSVALTAFWAWNAERLVSPRNMLISIVFCTGGGFIILGASGGIWGIIVLFLIYLVRGIATLFLKDYMNRYTSSDVGAIVFSVRSSIIRIGFAVISPFLGWYTDHYGLKHALVIAGSIFLLSMLAVIVVFWKSIKKS